MPSSFCPLLDIKWVNQTFKYSHFEVYFSFTGRTWAYIPKITTIFSTVSTVTRRLTARENYKSTFPNIRSTTFSVFIATNLSWTNTKKNLMYPYTIHKKLEREYVISMHEKRYIVCGRAFEKWWRSEGAPFTVYVM